MCLLIRRKEGEENDHIKDGQDQRHRDIQLPPGNGIVLPVQHIFPEKERKYKNQSRHRGKQNSKPGKRRLGNKSILPLKQNKSCQKKDSEKIPSAALIFF